MKNKTVLLMLLITLVFGNLQAQTYENVLKADSTSWISWHRELEYTMKDLAYVKNINGINYLYFTFAFDYPGLSYLFLVGTLRETDGQLWITYADDPNNEYLIMDMNLEVGDEFVFNPYNYTGTVVETRYENGRKIIVFDRPSYNWYQEPIMFIEGIGCNIMSWEQNGGWDYSYQSCKFDGQELAYSTPNTHFRDCEIITDDTEDNMVDNQEVEVYPNPTNGVINLSFAEGTECRSVEIHAIDGRLLKSQSSDLETVDMSGLEPGIYIIKVRLSDGREHTERVVRE
ncbi:MAG: T9SS type A sorting domain-containing protein [Bacteroidales bacterium]|nr:T9SS type A sorting domain-containing protein [Bacteroidales bacterium]